MPSSEPIAITITMRDVRLVWAVLDIFQTMFGAMDDLDPAAAYELGQAKKALEKVLEGKRAEQDAIGIARLVVGSVMFADRKITKEEFVAGHAVIEACARTSVEIRRCQKKTPNTPH